MEKKIKSAEDITSEENKDKAVTEEGTATGKSAEETESHVEAADFVLKDGSVVEEEVKLEDVEDKDFSKITKEDGTEIFVETPEVEPEMKEAVYEAIVNADSEVVAETLEEINAPEDDEEIESVMYAPVALPEIQASLNNSYYVFKLKSGKMKAIKAGHILSPKLKNAILKSIEAKKELPTEQELFHKIAAKIGNKYGAFKKMAFKFVKAATSPESFAVKPTELGEAAKKPAMAVAKDPANNPEKVPATEVGAPQKSDVSALFGKLPSKAKTKDGLTVGLAKTNEDGKVTAPAAKVTTASQIKALRQATKEKLALKASLDAANKEKAELQKKLQAAEEFKKELSKSALVKKVLEALHIETEEEKEVMTKKLDEKSETSLKDMLEILTATPELDVDKMQEEEFAEAMKKDASLLKNPIPTAFLKSASKADEEDLGKLLIEIEKSQQTQHFN